MAYCDLQHMNMQHGQQDINTDELYAHACTQSPPYSFLHAVTPANVICFSQGEKKSPSQIEPV